MLPRLQAEQHLMNINIGFAVGGVGLKEKERAEFMQGLESQSKGTTRARKATTTTLASMGIVSRTEPGSKDK